MSRPASAAAAAIQAALQMSSQTPGHASAEVQRTRDPEKSPEINGGCAQDSSGPVEPAATRESPATVDMSRPLASPSLPLSLLDRILCYCKLDDYRTLRETSRAVSELVRQPHVLCELFRNSFHPSTALLKALQTYPQFDLALAQCFTKWYMPLPRYVLQWLRVDRHGPSLTFDGFTPLSSPSTPTTPNGTQRIPKDAYMYLMTQGYCRYVKPELNSFMNSFMVETDDLEQFVFLLAELPETESRSQQKELLNEIWELATVCHAPLSLLTPTNSCGLPIDLAHNIYRFYERCNDLRFEPTWNAFLNGGFNFRAFNVGWEQGKDFWSIVILDELSMLDSFTEKAEETRWHLAPFALNLHFWGGCFFSRNVIYRLIAGLLRVHEHKMVASLIMMGRTAGVIPFEAPSRAASYFISTCGSLSRTLQDNLRFIVQQQQAPIFADVSLYVAEEYLGMKCQNGGTDTRVVEIALSAAFVIPEMSQLFEHVLSRIQPSQADFNGLQARMQEEGNWDQARLQAELEHLKISLTWRHIQPRLYQRLQIYALSAHRVDYFRYFLKKGTALALDALRYLIRLSHENDGLGHVWDGLLFEGDNELARIVLDGIKSQLAVERRHRLDQARLRAQPAAGAGSQVAAAPDEVRLDFSDEEAFEWITSMAGIQTT